MDKEILIEYYISLNALQRAEKFLREINIKIPDHIIEKTWKFENFFVGKIVPFKTLDRLIAKDIRKHEEDGYPEVLYSYYLFSLSDFVSFFLESDIQNLKSTQNSILELYVYKSAHDYMFQHGGGAFILTDEQNLEIETSETVENEKKMQNQDRLIAEKKFT